MGPDGRFRSVNRQFAGMLGYRPEELGGRSFKELTHPDDRDRGDRERDLLMDGKIPTFSLRKRYLRKDGTPVEVRLIESPDQDAKGRTGLTKFVADVGDEACTAEELRMSEERYRKIVETSMEGIFILDRDAMLVFVNRMLAQMLGYTAEEMLGRSMFDFMEPDIAVLARRNLELRRRTGLKNLVDYRYRRRDGGTIRTISSTNTMYEREGEFAGVLGMVIDISDRKAEEHLNSSLNAIANAINSTLDLDEMLDRVVHVAGRALNADAASVLLHEEGHWVARAAWGRKEVGLEVGKTYLAEQLPPLAKVVVSKSIEASTAPPDQGKGAWSDGKYQPRQYVFAPLMVRDELIGVIGFSSRSPAPVFDQRKIDFARRLSTSLSLALENVRLYQLETRQRELFQAIFDNAPMGIAVLNGEDLRVKYADNEFPRFFDEPPDHRKVVGKMLIDVISRADAAMMSDVAAMVGASRKPYVDREYEVIGSSGITYWSISAIPLIAGGGRPDILLLVNNVTGPVHARKKIEDLANKASSERARLRTILDTLPRGVVILDSEGKVSESNDMRDNIWRGGAPPSQGVAGCEDLKAWWVETGKKVEQEQWPAERAYRTGELTLEVMIDMQRMEVAGAPS